MRILSVIYGCDERPRSDTVEHVIFRCFLPALYWIYDSLDAIILCDSEDLDDLEALQPSRTEANSDLGLLCRSVEGADQGYLGFCSRCSGMVCDIFPAYIHTVPTSIPCKLPTCFCCSISPIKLGRDDGHGVASDSSSTLRSKSSQFPSMAMRCFSRFATMQFLHNSGDLASLPRKVPKLLEHRDLCQGFVRRRSKLLLCKRL